MKEREKERERKGGGGREGHSERDREAKTDERRESRGEHSSSLGVRTELFLGVSKGQS